MLKCGPSPASSKPLQEISLAKTIRKTASEIRESRKERWKTKGKARRSPREKWRERIGREIIRHYRGERG